MLGSSGSTWTSENECKARGVLEALTKYIINGYGKSVNADHVSAAIKGAAEKATQARRKRIKVVTVCADALRLIALSVRIAYGEFVDQLLWHWGRSREGHLKVQKDTKLSHL